MTPTLPDPATTPTIDASTAASIFGCSVWSLYEQVKRGDCPVEPLRLGRKLRWPTARVLDAVGLHETQPA